MPRATTSTSISALASNSAVTPYKIGFQPAGVKSDRSEEFARARKGLGEAREREEGRLGRRWAKVCIDLLPAVDLRRLGFEIGTDEIIVFGRRSCDISETGSRLEETLGRPADRIVSVGV
jgi:hypothetical protein